MHGLHGPMIIRSGYCTVAGKRVDWRHWTDVSRHMATVVLVSLGTGSHFLLEELYEKL